MVMKMNKTGFIKELSKVTGYSIDDCIIINDVLENNFFISKKSKDKIVNELISSLKINETEATSIYENAKMIFNNEIKNKLKHPFKSQN